MQPPPPQVLLSFPQHIAFGPGSVLRCVEILARREVRRLFVVSSPRAVKAGAALFELLRTRGVELAFFSGIQAETSIEHFESAVSQARDFRPDGVLGLGGGSALDLAKLVAALHDGSQKVEDAIGIDVLQGRRTFLLCVPTTAGTGSEVSPNALLLDRNHVKKAVISPWLVPDAAYIDPELMTGVPADMTAYTGIDALTHCIEAFANKFAHPAVDLYALEGMRLIARNLPIAVADGADVAARAQVALGSMYGGLCLGPVNTAVVHALAYGLAAELGLGHGLSNALLLVHVLRFNLPAAPERYAAMAVALGVPGGQDDIETAKRGIDFLEQLCSQCGIPRTISELGFSAEVIPKMAAEAIKVQRLLKNNLREVTLEDAVGIYRSAF